MGTNYYLRLNTCPTCKRAESELHIGKSSAGWCFALHVIPEESIHVLSDWEKRWADGLIFDEYGDQVSPEKMLSVICDRECPPFDGNRKWIGYEGEADFHRKNHSQRGPKGLLRHKIDGRNCVAHGDGTWDLIAGCFS